MVPPVVATVTPATGVVPGVSAGGVSVSASAGPTAGSAAAPTCGKQPSATKTKGPLDLEDSDDEADLAPAVDPATNERGGPTRGGTRPEPTRFGDWERGGRCVDF